MPLEVTDTRSNTFDQIRTAAKILGRSEIRQKMFEIIYSGQQKTKSKSVIIKTTKFKEKSVLRAGLKLIANHIVDKEKIDGETAYSKILFIADHKNTILQLARDKQKLAKYHSKVTPQINIPIKSINKKIITKPYNISHITIDDIDNFKKVRKIKKITRYNPIDEKLMKYGIKTIINESGKFTDWGGEKNDLFSTKVIIDGKRVTTVFAFKGKGTKGILRPSMMGRNGDQIQRLFTSSADFFILQYWGQIDESIYEQMHKFAIHKSVTENKKIYYCIIDGSDTQRIVIAYHKYFK